MPTDHDNEWEMKFMLLQESIWNNGEMINRVLEHVIAHETYLLKLMRQVELIAQRFGMLSNGTKQQSPKLGKH